jgi:VWFA-related protein
MSFGPALQSALLAGVLGALLAAGSLASAQTAALAPAQSLTVALASVAESVAAAADAPDAGLYADGTRAINDGRWPDAVQIFTNVAQRQGPHADGALYWKAYAQNRQGLGKQALDTCVELRHSYPKSRWLDECAALAIEIHAQHGKPDLPQAGQNEDLQLLALNSMMQTDEARALAEIERIVKGDASQKTKENALFVLAQNHSRPAEEMLGSIAQGQLHPAQLNTALQARARQLLVARRGPPPLAAAQSNRTLTLDVVVTDKSGQRIPGLDPRDFSLQDNKQPRSIARVRSAGAQGDPPVEAIILVDGINATFDAVAEERQALTLFANQNGGRLAVPTSLLFLTDSGVKLQTHPTQDGKVLLDYMDHTVTGLRILPRQDPLDRERLSLNALEYIATETGKRPGRKLLIWLSPGWPLMTDESWKGTTREKLWVLHTVVGMSTALREARITLYNINPFGVGHGHSFYQRFLKYPNTPNEADYGNLFLQVLAVQSGGTVQFGSNDMANQIGQCIADGAGFYELTFDAPVAAAPNESHSLEIKLAKPGLLARTRTGYYAQP